MLLSRECAKFPLARRKAEIAAGIAKAMSRTHFGLTTLPAEISAVRSKNEFLEVPISIPSADSRCFCMICQVFNPALKNFDYCKKFDGLFAINSPSQTSISTKEKNNNIREYKNEI